VCVGGGGEKWERSKKNEKWKKGGRQVYIYAYVGWGGSQCLTFGKGTKILLSTVQAQATLTNERPWGGRHCSIAFKELGVHFKERRFRRLGAQ
jgi:hypothetical protein